MPRRNDRTKAHIPLDLTPTEIAKIPRPKPIGHHNPVEDRLTRRVEQADRQRDARMQNGIDWSVCLVPGCGNGMTYAGTMLKRPEDRDVSRYLPLCIEHALLAWRVVEHARGRPAVIEANETFLAREAERRAAAEQAEKAAFLLRQDGDMYFIRLNGMVKVGWSRNLRGRIKSYGASAEVLCHYPATRDDETNLHRQLRPALAKGREWYHDGDIINMYIANALKQYGPPTVEARWTEPKDIIRTRRTR